MADSKAYSISGEPESIRATDKIPYWRMVFDQAGVTTKVMNFGYEGSGTKEDPFVVTWIPDDPRNPMNFSSLMKWLLTLLTSTTTLGIAFASSAYSGAVPEIMAEFDVSQELAILGISLFVLGFALGPLLWAPLSELFGRQALFFVTYALLTAFNAGCAGAGNYWTLMILRFFAGTFGSSPLTNSGGIIADIFPAAQRGMALAIFAAAPFLGPVLGPIVGGFLGVAAGWRWTLGFLGALSGTLWILGSCLTPETYAPVLLRKRARKLSKLSGKHYISTIDHHQGPVTLSESFLTALSRPWVLLLKEPIVLLLSVYMAIIYGTLYMLFAAFPIVYQQNRGWSAGISGLAFLGIMIGMMFAITYSFPDNARYIRVQKAHGGFAPPEARLVSTMIASIFLPIGLFWFAWTNQPELHWAISIAAGIPFGFGMVLVFLSINNYLVDSYTIFAASVLAASSILRSLFGAAFPLFTSKMYADLGIHWASSIPAFLATICVPFPFLFYKYGPAIRKRCKFAAESAAFMERLQENQATAHTENGEKGTSKRCSQEGLQGERASETGQSSGADTLREGPDNETGHPRHARVGSYATNASATRHSEAYEGNPYDIDRVNTRESFS